MSNLLITPHFSWNEIEVSPTAKVRGINNRVPQALEINVARMAQFMECVRALLGRNPIRVTSWYRSWELNEAVGGSTTSMHTKGLAVDFKAPEGHSLQDAFDEIRLSTLPYDQVIIERTRDGASWIHIGLTEEGEPRRMALDASGDVLGGSMVYRRILEG